MTAENILQPAVPGWVNFREVSGMRTRTGGRIKSGLLFRGGTPQFVDAPTARRVHDRLGLRTVIDLRQPFEAQQEGSGPFGELPHRYVNVAFDIGATVATHSAVTLFGGADPVVTSYLNYLVQSPHAIASVMTALAEPEALPAVLHCTVGKDRTGVAVAFLLELLDVERFDIVADYASSPDEVKQGMVQLRGMASYGDAIDLYEPDVWRADPDFIERFLVRVDEMYGGVQAFLAHHGVDEDLVHRLRNAFVEPIAPGV